MHAAFVILFFVNRLSGWSDACEITAAELEDVCHFKREPTHKPIRRFLGRLEKSGLIRLHYTRRKEGGYGGFEIRIRCDTIRSHPKKTSRPIQALFEFHPCQSELSFDPSTAATMAGRPPSRASLTDLPPTTARMAACLSNQAGLTDLPRPTEALGQAESARTPCPGDTTERPDIMSGRPGATLQRPDTMSGRSPNNDRAGAREEPQEPLLKKESYKPASEPQRLEARGSEAGLNFSERPRREKCPDCGQWKPCPCPRPIRDAIDESLHSERSSEPPIITRVRRLCPPRPDNDSDRLFIRVIRRRLDEHGADAHEIIARTLADAEERSHVRGKWRIANPRAWFQSVVSKRLTERLGPLPSRREGGARVTP